MLVSCTKRRPCIDMFEMKGLGRMFGCRGGGEVLRA
jgi:hypothetical protein